MSTHERADSPVALVTGAGSGIGRAIATQLAALGWRIMGVGRHEGTLRETLELCTKAGGPGGLVYTCDVGDADQGRTAVATAFSRFGRLDALINNAGAAPKISAAEHTKEHIAAAFAVNSIGPANMIAEALARWSKGEAPALDMNGTGQNKGKAEAAHAAARGPIVVNISSMAAADPFPGFFAYGASKAAVNLLTRAAHNEYGRVGLRAFAVAPGAVETPLLRTIFPKEALPTARCLTPEAVAKVVVECVLGQREQSRGEVILLPSP
jgi:NAD(P)-dependent dehydrogenase (short-subunit alcohol dehydrogenase family)